MWNGLERNVRGRTAGNEGTKEIKERKKGERD
jgi:hypothetical protein